MGPRPPAATPNPQLMTSAVLYLLGQRSLSPSVGKVRGGGERRNLEPKEFYAPACVPETMIQRWDGSLEIKLQRKGQQLAPKAGEMSRRGPSRSNPVIGSLESAAEAQSRRICSRSRKGAGRRLWDVLSPSHQDSHKRTQEGRRKRAWSRGQKSL